jgi:hypothetical protein
MNCVKIVEILINSDIIFKMSSSKSVAAARARRATETPAQRPRSSIGSFSQAPPPPSFAPQKNPRMAQQQQPVYQQQPGYQQQPQQQQKPKISIGNAIALVSLRIGRLEQLLQENSEGGLSLSLATNSTDNKQNTDVLDNIMNRLVLLENKPTFDKQAMDDVFSRLSRENKEIKDNFQRMVQQFNLFVKDTNEKFLDYEAAFVDMEQKMKSFVEEEVMEDPVDETVEDANEDTNTTILSEDIKN